jgi:hypothetical protein
LRVSAKRACFLREALIERGVRVCWWITRGMAGATAAPGKDAGSVMQVSEEIAGASQEMKGSLAGRGGKFT